MSRTAEFEVRCTPAEKAKWRAAAGKRGLSELVRRALIEYLDRHADAAAASKKAEVAAVKAAARPGSPHQEHSGRVTAAGSIERAEALLRRGSARPYSKEQSTR